jgi:NCS1 family nucleobase:cation symporter-1
MSKTIAELPLEASTPARGALSVEMNGINGIPEGERKGRPRNLFWPWFAGNISVFSVSYGSYVLGFGISFWQATIAAIIGVVASNILVGFVAIAGKRGSAPTLTLSRSIFGVRGNRVPAIISWLLTVGWETVVSSTAVLAIVTVCGRLGWEGGAVTKIVAIVIVVGLVVWGGTLGFDLIMKMVFWITIIVGVLTVVYIFMTAGHINFSTLGNLKGGALPAVIGATLFVMTGFGLGWVNMAADYSRYLPRNASSRGVVFWTTLGTSIPPLVLVLYGLLLSGSSPKLSTALASDPVGALTSLLPTWFLIPFAAAAVLGAIAGATLDIYSSGLSLLNAGLKIPRYAAVSVDGVLMTLGIIYIVFVASNFLAPFEGFLITLGVPIAAWCGIFLADLALRRKNYAEKDLFTPKGRYGDIRWLPIGILIVSTLIGWGLVTNTGAGWLNWQGYLLGPVGLGGKTGAWAYSNLGVIVALAVAFVITLILGRGPVRAQEDLPIEQAVPENVPAYEVER